MKESRRVLEDYVPFPCLWRPPDPWSAKDLEAWLAQMRHAPHRWHVDRAGYWRTAVLDALHQWHPRSPSERTCKKHVEQHLLSLLSKKTTVKQPLTATPIDTDCAIARIFASVVPEARAILPEAACTQTCITRGPVPESQTLAEWAEQTAARPMRSGQQNLPGGHLRWTTEAFAQAIFIPLVRWTRTLWIFDRQMSQYAWTDNGPGNQGYWNSLRWIVQTFANASCVPGELTVLVVTHPVHPQIMEQITAQVRMTQISGRVQCDVVFSTALPHQRYWRMDQGTWSCDHGVDILQSAGRMRDLDMTWHGHFQEIEAIVNEIHHCQTAKIPLS